MKKLNKFYNASFTSIFFILVCSAIGVVVNEYSVSKFDVSVIIPISFILVVTYHITVNAKKIFQKRSLGISLKELLFLYACMTTFTIVILTIPVLLENWKIALLISFFISLFMTMGVAHLLTMRKEQEFELMGFKLVGKYDMYKVFAEQDENLLEDLIKNKKVWKFSFFFGDHLFVRSIDVITFRNVEKILHRMKANPDLQTTSLLQQDFSEF